MDRPHYYLSLSLFPLPSESQCYYAASTIHSICLFTTSLMQYIGTMKFTQSHLVVLFAVANTVNAFCCIGGSLPDPCGKRRRWEKGSLALLREEDLMAPRAADAICCCAAASKDRCEASCVSHTGKRSIPSTSMILPGLLNRYES